MEYSKVMFFGILEASLFLIFAVLRLPITINTLLNRDIFELISRLLSDIILLFVAYNGWKAYKTASILSTKEASITNVQKTSMMTQTEIEKIKKEINELKPKYAEYLKNLWLYPLIIFTYVGFIVTLKIGPLIK